MITRHQPALVPTNSPNTPMEQQQPALQQAAGSDLQQMLSANAASCSANITTCHQWGQISGMPCTRSKVYHARNNNETHTGSLVDGGCNGGIARSNVRVLETTLATVDVTGVGENLLKNLPIVTVAGVINTQKGPIVGMFHQYANYAQGKTIHSSNQIRDFGLTINDVPHSSGGKQSIVSKDGYHIPLAVREGLCYMDMQPPTDEELGFSTAVNLYS